MIKSKRIRWTRLGEKRNAYRKLMEKPEGKTLLEDQDVCRWIILK
jgi:hypothetical protein